jgi:hypothetical protein
MADAKLPTPESEEDSEEDLPGYVWKISGTIHVCSGPKPKIGAPMQHVEAETGAGVRILKQCLCDMSKANAP